ncbi:capsular biosynthesis protein [Cyclobacterium sp. GBPx2]|uniref:Capsular biosynthesis protein n=2 Tax=Cyclobacterium plantarum TaxID=2716263 RepID=A0ABX0H5J7_9BACT|nr:capsular biosynthesis protein [Cyclobacterium plantarum]
MEDVLIGQKFGRSEKTENFVKQQQRTKIINLYGQNDNLRKRAMKRTFDLVISLFTMVFIVSWLFPIVALLIKWDSKGPVFFKQLRHGRGNKKFYCYKFRTMVKNKEADTRQATQNDARITKIGKFLRKTSLDELPQIFNVILGDMSIVGPRPHSVPMNLEFAKEIENFMQRHQVKPGITGLAQCKGLRGEISSFQELYSRFRLDFFYVKKWCLIFDIKIVIETAISLLTKNEKAY